MDERRLREREHNERQTHVLEMAPQLCSEMEFRRIDFHVLFSESSEDLKRLLGL
jgi:hypothetical protein